MRYLLKILTAALFVVKNCCNLAIEGASLVAQLVKNLPAMQETLVRSLGLGRSTHYHTLAWRIPWTVQSMGSQSVGHDRETSAFTFRDV